MSDLLYEMFKSMGIKSFAPLTVFLLTISMGYSAPIDISKSGIIISPDIKSTVQASALEILQEEIQKRNGATWKKIDAWSRARKTVIALTLSTSGELAGVRVPVRPDKSLPEWQPEGFRLLYDQTGETDILWIIGADSRAVIFGIGKLLRTAKIGSGHVIIDDQLDVASSPAYSLRGHQIGYRNTANSYDAWSVEQYDRYIRALALFGTNAVENIPPLKKDPSPHFKISREEMHVKMSAICDKYDIEYWVWTPAVVDLTDEGLRTKELDLHEANYKKVPRLDNIFFPGGDPGHNHPREVMPFLKDLHSRLVKYHPDAGIWISLQGFSQEQIDYFYQYLKAYKPAWLRGVVSGPSSPSISETRYRLPEQYKHRHYPDITHNVRCDYPALNFDQAFALTIGREGINPQPVYYAKIHEKYAPFTDGFISYSDGCHDDVNKVIWSQRAWNPHKSVRDILIEYSRFFFNAKVGIAATEGILGLEKNWDGSLKDNGSVEPTLAFWQNLEDQYPKLSSNWRWQLLVLRAYYDAYIRRRLINETKLESQANKVLEKAGSAGLQEAMNNALEIVKKADAEPIANDLRKTIDEYCEKLFRSCGLQTSVDRYKASNSQRGCILDFVDYPLNNRWWLEDQFKLIAQMKTEEEKLERIKIIYSWENPGPGSYYDNVSNIAQSPRVTTTVYDAVDFGWWDSGYCRWRLSSQVYQNDPVLEYEDLDPDARYIVRVAGYGEALIRIDGHRLEPLVYDKEREGFKEFVVPKQAVGDGQIRITFDRPEESHLRWKYYSSVSDVWLIKR
ncbi:MAG: hypothetical protein MI975_17800 [Cytophagales bacterium]|nr:hypothetical protein [Cytophagales bacterium]